MKRLSLYLLLTILWTQSYGQIVFPDDAIVNVLDYRGDISIEDFKSGNVDVSDAILAAIEDNVEAKIADNNDIAMLESYVLYFPEGTYLVSKPLEVDSYSDPSTGGGGTGKTINFQGAGKDFTIIKLQNGAAGFGDPDNPVPVLSNTEANPLPNSWNNIAFMGSIWDLTVDVGSGNPGAIGVAYISSNQGSIRDVNIIGDGHTGIDMDEQSIPGPALIKNVLIDGFEYGIRVADENYTMTIEDITIRNARIGINNNRHILTVRKLTTENISEFAINNTGPANNGFLTLLDSDLGGSGVNAIESTTYLFARNVTQTGFTNILNDLSKSEILSETSITEYVSHGTFSLADNAATSSINLDIEETPEVDWSTSPENWVSVLDHGYILGSDTGFFNAVQAAVDFMNEEGNEAKNVLYFPIGDYKATTAKTINIYGNVKKVMGNLASIRVNLAKSHDLEPMFNIQDTDYPNLFIERFNFTPRPWKKKHAVFRNQSSKDVVIRHIYIGHGKAYENRGATGKLFMEDVAALSQIYWAILDPTGQAEPYDEALPQFDFGNQKVWIRQFDPEQKFTHAESDGGQLWILGLKIEEPGTLVHAKNGAKVEVLGGCALMAFPDSGDPMFKLENSEGSFVISEHVSSGKFDVKAYYSTFVEEVRGNVTRKLVREDLPERWILGRAVPLFIGFGGTMPEVRSINTSINDMTFGEIEVVKSKKLSFTIENDGNTLISIDEIIVPEGFEIDWTSGSIEAEGSQEVNVVFSPSEVKIYSGQLVINSDAEPGSLAIALSGEGIEEIVKELNMANELDFGEVQIGESKTLPFVFKNIGNTDLTISDISMASRFTASRTSFTIVPQEEIQVDFTFSPSTIRDYSVTFRVESDITIGKNSFVVKASGAAVVLSTKEKDTNVHGIIYPNPNNGIFKINSVDAKDLRESLKVFDSSGRELSNDLIEMESGYSFSPPLKSGAYLIKYKTDGEFVNTKLIIN